MEEFYSYSEIQFRRDECLWVLRNAESFSEGKWPPEPFESGYIDSGVRRKVVKREPGFVKPKVIIAEIMWRLERTGVDGKLLIAEVKADYELFSDEAWAALNYISGWKRKAGYSAWKAKRKWRKRDKNILIGVKS